MSAHGNTSGAVSGKAGGSKTWRRGTLCKLPAPSAATSPDACPVGRVPAAEIEGAVIDQLRGIFRQPEIVVGTWRAARAKKGDITEDEAREAMLQLDPLWEELFPAEQARVVRLLVERVDIAPEGADIRLRTEGLTKLVADLGAIQPEARRAA